MQLEYPVAECLQHPSEFVFSELNLNQIYNGDEYLIDTLKQSLVAKTLEASTDVHYSVCLVVSMLRSLFLQKVMHHCFEDFSLKKSALQMDQNNKVRKLKIESPEHFLLKHYTDRN